jgi:Cu2+-exporting ATPase
VVTNALRLNLFNVHSTRHDHKHKQKQISHTQIQEEQTMEKTLNIEGMMCAHCEAHVKKALEALEQVDQAVVSHEAGTAVITLNAPVDEAALRQAVEAEGYKVV